MRLDRFLSEMGVDSRSDIKKALHAGRCSVNGKIRRDPATVVSENDDILYRGTSVPYAPVVYYMLHKPAGVVSATEDRRQKTVLDLLRGEGEKRRYIRKDVSPVGRLDKDTEGLLLLTNDGDLSHRLLSPKKHVDKVYFARVAGRVSEETVEAFREGLLLPDGLQCLPAELAIKEAGPDESEVLVTIREGKFHQIKRMFQAVGSEVLYLKRLSMGPLTLDEALAPGDFRALTDAEIAALKAL